MSDQSRPNIVFILSDDQGPWAANCLGCHEMITPNLDRLAAEGMRFSNFFCASPVCSPSRASFATGRLPSQHGVHDWLRPEGHHLNYMADEVMYTDILAEHGYHCGLSGKWHCGDAKLPQHGFDFWFAHQWGGGHYMKPPVFRDGEPVVENQYVTDLFTDEALNFLDLQDGSRPFYLGVHYTAPHSPWTAEHHPQEYRDMYADCAFETCPQGEMHPWAGGLTKSSHGKREMLVGYFAAVTAMDAQIGRILDRLDEMGVADNTLVVFTSDNGFSCGHKGFWGKGNATRPINMFENSVRIPFIVRHPARVPAGRVCEAMVSAYDFMPTLLDYVGLPCPTDARNLPGQSVVPLLEGAAGEGRDDVVVHDEYGYVRMVRTRDWKYIHRYPDGPHELYDLANDPTEDTNLVDAPAHADRRDAMRARLETWFDQYATAEQDGRQFPVTGEGQPSPSYRVPEA